MTGILLMNVGTPDAPDVASVRRYLREFLMDRWVIDLPAPMRWLLVHGLILPRRPQESSKLYQSIWTDAGSPLLVHSRNLAQAVQEKLGPDFRVEIAMRYGQPSAAQALRRLASAGISKLIALPLFPQASLATTHSAIEDLEHVLRRSKTPFSHQVIREFYSHSGFIEAFAARIQESFVKDGEPDLLLFSFHGLPVRHLEKQRKREGSDYQAQALTTAELIAKRLGLSRDRYEIGFQSRFGRAEWIGPFTETLLTDLPTRGVKKLAVACPSFVADCLETLEEIGIRGRETFLRAGGETFTLIPCLNSHSAWVDALSDLIRSRAG